LDVIALRPLLSIKTLYRSPVRTLLTFVLLGVVTFAFFSQTAEYAITAREFNNAAKQYCGVGAAEAAPAMESDPRFPDSGFPNYIEADPRMPQYRDAFRYQPLWLEQVSTISELPYITSADTRYMTAGVSDTYERLDDGEYFYNYTARCVIEGTLKEVLYGDPITDTVNIIDFVDNKLILGDCRLLAGNPPVTVDYETLTVFAYPLTVDENTVVPMGAGMYKRLPGVYTSNYVYDTEYVKNMTPGSRYVFVLRFDPLDGRYLFVGDHQTNSWCDAVQRIDGEPANYLQLQKFAPLRLLIAIINADAHTFDVVYTDDMSAILRFAEGDMAITSVRALDREDSGADVCVVSKEFADANALKVGDTITMKLGTELFEQYKGLGAVAAVPERYKPAEKTVTLEIVGIYADTDGPNRQSQEPNWSYSINTIFVPKSLLPVDASQLKDHVFSPAEFSFKVENAWDIPAFLEESAPRFAEMGLKLIFDDAGWPNIADTFKAARQISLIKIAVMSAAVAAATGFVVYLFIGRKKKEYAVMRALGTTIKDSARALVLPLMIVAAISVLVGSAAGWIYTVKTIAHNNTISLLKDYAVSTAVPAEAVTGCILGEILLTLLIALILLRHIGKLSPLALLQDNGSRRARGKHKVSRGKQAYNAPKALPAADDAATRAVRAGIQAAAFSGVSERIRPRRGSRSFKVILRYIGRHMHRAIGKTALAVLLAALLLVAVGQLALTRQSYDRLCVETVITARFAGGLELNKAFYIKNSG
jgi:hypothetical protein